jgi:uncharacterized surface protein with fasciclin (FAS1) repeats
MKSRKHLHTSCLLATTLISTAPFSTAQSLLEHVESTGEFTVLLEALEVSGLKEVLAGAGPYTLFAPNDAAFGKLRPGTMNTLMSLTYRDELAEIMKYHVVEGNPDLTTAATNQQNLISMMGGEIALSNADGVSLNDEARVIAPAIVTDNGVIHIIDSVIFPE